MLYFYVFDPSDILLAGRKRRCKKITRFYQPRLLYLVLEEKSSDLILLFPKGGVQKQFRTKNLRDWSGYDVCEWLDSLFMPEYKVCKKSISESRLTLIGVTDNISAQPN